MVGHADKLIGGDIVAPFFGVAPFGDGDLPPWVKTHPAVVNRAEDTPAIMGANRNEIGPIGAVIPTTETRAFPAVWFKTFLAHSPPLAIPQS